MLDKKYCSGCKKEFKDGELVAVSDNEGYHTIIRELYSIPIDCSMKAAMDGPVIFNRNVYYQGKFYNLNAIDSLRNVNDLILDFNDERTGDIIKGNLEGLIKKKRFWIF